MGLEASDAGFKNGECNDVEDMGMDEVRCYIRCWRRGIVGMVMPLMASYRLFVPTLCDSGYGSWGFLQL